FCFSTPQQHPPTLFPYTTLFRSSRISSQNYQLAKQQYGRNIWCTGISEIEATWSENPKKASTSKPSEKEPHVDRCQSSSKEENPHSKSSQGSPRKRTRKAKT